MVQDRLPNANKMNAGSQRLKKAFSVQVVVADETAIQPRDSPASIGICVVCQSSRREVRIVEPRRSQRLHGKGCCSRVCEKGPWGKAIIGKMHPARLRSCNSIKGWKEQMKTCKMASNFLRTCQEEIQISRQGLEGIEMVGLKFPFELSRRKGRRAEPKI